MPHETLALWNVPEGELLIQLINADPPILFQVHFQVLRSSGDTAKVPNWSMLKVYNNKTNTHI